MRVIILFKGIVLFLVGWLLHSDLLAQSNDPLPLNDGDWYKMEIAQTGMYRIDANFLRQAGINLDGLNPEFIQIYGVQGGMLEQNHLYTNSLTSQSTHIVGLEDGRFDDADYILFYAEGPDKWSYDADTRRFAHEKNLYADVSYYFLRIGQDIYVSSSPMYEAPSVENTDFIHNVYDDYFFHEVDENIIVNSGREWYGEQFGFLNEQTFNFPIPGLILDAPLTITSAVMARDVVPSSFDVSVAGQPIGTQEVLAVTDQTYDFKGRDQVDIFETRNPVALNGENLDITLRFNAQTSGGNGYLNYLRVQAKRRLALIGAQTSFRVLESANYASNTYVIDNVPENASIWRIGASWANIHHRQSYRREQNQAIFGLNSESPGQISEFVVFVPQMLNNPNNITLVSPQNLAGLSTPNLVIVSHPDFLTEAQRLADFRRSHDQLTVEVVTTEQIYNEFSGGRQDVTAIRDFTHWLYRRNPSVLKYLLLFGDASFDYKNRVNNNTNFVPIYESRESLHPIFSYSSDDYFGFLEEGEGTWEESRNGDHSLEIGVGRLPVKNITEARAVVDKLIHYATVPQAFGNWRNTLCFVADDGDSNIHQRDADDLAENIEDNYIDYNSLKFYMDAFPQVPEANGEVAPELKSAITSAVEDGSLIINFTGHGGEIGWTEEKILDIPQIQSWRNLDNMPLFVTATCEFGRYDDPNQVSGAEEVILNPRGGGIALITTTRPVFSSTNFALNRAFYASVFERIDGKLPRLGDIVRITKNNSLNGSVNRNFSLLGDPSMRLAYPEEEAVITAINNVPVTEARDTVSALETVEITGEIQDQDGNRKENFSGQVTVNVFDKRQEVQTLGTSARVMAFQDRNAVLFRGLADVKEGRFNLRFVIPKDIDYRLGLGKISLYAKNSEANADANGGYKEFFIGTTLADVPADNTPPNLDVFLNDENFQSGDIVQQDALLLAKLSDENGINISEAGIGHEITMRLDGQEVVNLNYAYVADPNTFQSGTLRHPLKDLSIGKHQLTLKAWDTHNNSNQKTIEFLVAEDAGIALEEILNFPNPFRDQTKFRLHHNRVSDDLEVLVRIYDYQGNLVHALGQTINNSNSPIELDWNGLDEQGNRIGNGLYLYEVQIRSLEDQSSIQAVKRLVIIN